MDIERLITLTEELLRENEFAKMSYLKAREGAEVSDFFTVVKPFADKVQSRCAEWVPLAEKWIDEFSPRHLHVNQIKNTAENIQMISVRCFYAETSLKRFNSHVQSVDYVLSRLLNEIKQINTQ